MAMVTIALWVVTGVCLGTVLVGVLGLAVWNARRPSGRHRR